MTMGFLVVQSWMLPPSLKLPSPSRTDLSRDYAGQDGGQAMLVVGCGIFLKMLLTGWDEKL